MSNGTAPIRIRMYYMESTGAGHRRAAEAVAGVLRAGEVPVDLQLVNIVEYMNEGLHQFYQALRTWLISDAPHVLGQLYAWMDRLPSKDESVLQRALKGLERTSLYALLQAMRESPCDLAIHTHFFPAELAAYLRGRDEVAFPSVTVTTDYFSHALWAQEPCELFFVASKDAGRYLEVLGAAPDQIVESGIPVDAAFGAARRSPEGFRDDQAARADALRARARPPRVLLSATGVDPETAQQNLSDLLTAQRPLEVTVLAGGSTERREALESLEPSLRHQVRVHGPRDDMARLLEHADIAVGKAGGLTCAEAMAVGCPMAILRPRPDQEEQNADYLLEQQAAFRIFRSSLLGPKLDGLFGEELDRWSRARARAYALGRPEAAQTVADRSLALVTRARA